MSTRKVVFTLIFGPILLLLTWLWLWLNTNNVPYLIVYVDSDNFANEEWSLSVCEKKYDLIKAVWTSFDGCEGNLFIENKKTGATSDHIYITAPDTFISFKIIDNKPIMNDNIWGDHY